MTAITETAVCRIVARAADCGRDVAITPSTSLRRDLGIDSIGMMTLVVLLDEELGVDAYAHVQAFIEAESVADVIAAARAGAGAS